MKTREPLEYLKDLLEDITYAVESEDDSTTIHNRSDIVNLQNVINVFKEMQDKLENALNGIELIQIYTTIEQLQAKVKVLTKERDMWKREANSWKLDD